MKTTGYFRTISIAVTILMILSLVSVSCKTTKTDETDPVTTTSSVLSRIDWQVYDYTQLGLPDEATMSCITSDPSGNKWIGTRSSGLVRFDSTRTSRLYTSDNSPLRSNAISIATVDNNGNTWIGTSSGIVEISGNNWKTYHDSNSLLLTNQVADIQFDHTNVAWIANWNELDGGLLSFDGRNWNIYTPGNSLLPHPFVDRLAVDSANAIWAAISTQHIVCKIENGFGFGQWSIFDTTNTDLFPDQPSQIHLACDPDHHTWAAFQSSQDASVQFNGTVLKYDGNRWENLNPINSGKLSDNNLNCIKTDTYGNLWFSAASDYKLGMYDNNQWILLEELDPSFPSGSFIGMCFDADRVLWVLMHPVLDSDAKGLIEIHLTWQE